MDTNDAPAGDPRGRRSGPVAPRKTQAIAVWATLEQRATIERLAGSAGLSMSVYLRTLGLGYEPKSILDAESVGELLAACGELGKLGGVLKQYLTEWPGQGGAAFQVRRLLEQIQALREQIVEKVAAV